MELHHPDNLVPPEDPNVIWCDHCGDQVIMDSKYEEDTGVRLLFGIIVHDDCLADYAEGLQVANERLEQQMERMVERDFSNA